MKKNTKKIYRNILITLGFVFAINLSIPIGVRAATSPMLDELSNYSVLGGAAVTCNVATTTSGAVGVSPGTSITGFPAPCTAGGGTHSNDASAIAAQAENLATYAALGQPCDQNLGAVDLTIQFPAGVGPGVYCSSSSFSLSGNLALTGSGVWIFKTASTLITSPNSSVTGGDPCNVWWRIGSSATLDTSTSFVGSIFALNGLNAMNSGTTVNGRIFGQAAATVELNGGSITGPVCAATTTGGSGLSGNLPTPGLPNTGIAPETNNDYSWYKIIPALTVVTLLLSYLARKRQAR